MTCLQGENFEENIKKRSQLHKNIPKESIVYKRQIEGKYQWIPMNNYR